MLPDLNIKVENKLVLAPQIKQAIELLQLPTLDLEKRIQEEIIKNPLLEENIETQKSSEDFSKIEEEVSSREQAEEILRYFDDSSDVGSYYRTKEKEQNKQKFLEGVLNKPESLEEHLLWQLSLETTSEFDFNIGEVIISNISEEGYFKGNIEEISKLFNRAVKDIEKVLTLIQSFDPFGVGARDIQECLLIQLKYNPNKDQWAERIVEHHFQLLEKHKFKEISRKLGTTVASVKKSDSIATDLA